MTSEISKAYQREYHKKRYHNDTIYRTKKLAYGKMYKKKVLHDSTQVWAAYLKRQRELYSITKICIICHTKFKTSHNKKLTCTTVCSKLLGKRTKAVYYQKYKERFRIKGHKYYHTYYKFL